MSENRFFFLHIPKTAGSSLHRLLGQIGGPYLHLKHPHELHWPAADLWKRFRGCGGHTNWREAQLHGFMDGAKLTFLRDPVKRVLSQIIFSRLPTHGDRPESILARKYGILDLLRKTTGQFGPFWNLQTLALSGLGGDENRPEKHLESALKNIERLDFIGTTETFADDIKDLVSFFGAPSQPEIPRENVTPSNNGQLEVDPEIVGVLEETQSMDQILYARARELRTYRKPSVLSHEGRPPIGWPPVSNISEQTDAVITVVTVSPVEGQTYHPDSELVISIGWTINTPTENATVGFMIEDLLGNYVAGTTVYLLTGQYLSSKAETNTASFKFRISFGAGHYTVSAALYRSAVKFCWFDSAATFEVSAPGSPYREGLADIKADVIASPK